MKGEPYNYREIVEGIRDYINSKSYQFWKEQEALKRKEGSVDEKWMVGYGACLTEINKTFKEIMEKHKAVDDGN